MLKSTMILFGCNHNTVTEEVWMGGKFHSREVRHIPGFQQAIEGDNWQEFLRKHMDDANRDSFENLTQVIVLHEGKTYLVEAE